MAITQVDIMRMNEFLQGKVESFYNIIPSSTKMDIQELFGVLMKMFRNGLKTGRKDLYLLNILIAMDSIIDELSDCGDGLDTDLGEEARELKAEYLEYAEKKGQINEDILKKVTLFNQYIYIGDSIYDLKNDGESPKEEQVEEAKEPEKSEEEQKQEMYEKIASSFTSLNQENAELRTQVTQLRKELSASKKNEKSLQKRYDEAERSVRGLKDEKRAAEKRSISLENSLNQERHIVEKKTTQLEKSESEKDSLKRQIKELDKLRAEVEEYRKREKGLKTLNKSNNIDVVRKKVKRAMISLLMENTITFDDLEKELAKKELLMDRVDLFSIFKEINQEYNVTVRNKSKSSSLCYAIENPILKSYQTTSIKAPLEDILLTSDWHAYDLDDKRLFNRIDLLLNYCAQYGISTTINLGDFYDYRLNGSLTRAQNSIDAKNRLEALIQKIPYQKDMIHYVLGANHDEILRRYRLDTLGIIENMRPDYISLGYHHAILDINGTPFGLHHPESKLDNLNDFKNALNSWSQTDGFNAEDMYMNLFGHFHKYQFFPSEGILSCQSLMRDFNQDGAIHLRIRYDSNGKVSRVDIIPLNISYSVKRCKPQAYQKKLQNNSNK